MELQVLLDEDDVQNTKTTRKIIGHLWERFRRPIEGTTRIERQVNGKAQKYLRNFARTIQKDVVFASHRYWG